MWHIPGSLRSLRHDSCGRIPSGSPLRFGGGAHGQPSSLGCMSPAKPYQATGLSWRPYAVMAVGLRLCPKTSAEDMKEVHHIFVDEVFGAILETGGYAISHPQSCACSTGPEAGHAAGDLGPGLPYVRAHNAGHCAAVLCRQHFDLSTAASAFSVSRA